MELLKHEEFGEFRMQLVDGEPWFVAKDICEALGLKNPRNIVRHHCFEEDVQKIYSLTKGGKQQLLHVNESGIYALIFNSEKEQAKKFKHWVTSEVLPSLRKHKTYTMPNTDTGEGKPRRYNQYMATYNARAIRCLMAEFMEVESLEQRRRMMTAFHLVMDSARAKEIEE